jgi:DNA-binding transcriptional LysR family regulator
MELRHLRSFIAVAEELHFTRAANRVHITTPSLSERIRYLEDELGVQLLSRTKRSVVLTEAGSRFLREAREVVSHADRATLAAQRAGRGEVGRVALGYVTSVACSGLVSNAMAEFIRRRPLVDVDLVRLDGRIQMEGLIAGTLDVGFLRPPQRYPVGLNGIVLHSRPLLLAMPHGHRLSRIGNVPIARLEGESFITPSLEVELGFFAHIGEIGRQGGFEPKITRRVRDFITALTLVAAGCGVALVPESFRCIRLPGVIYRNLVETLDPGSFAAVYRHNEQAPATRALIELLGEIGAQETKNKHKTMRARYQGKPLRLT